MSKINVDEIKVGDLVSNYCSIMDKTDLGIVTKVIGEKVYAIWSCFMSTQSDSQVNYKELEGHWKVINFEEEAKMDELKVYTGKETIKALLDGKVLQYGEPPMKLKFENDKFLVDADCNEKWDVSHLTLQRSLELKFTEVVTPQVGDWVRVTIETGKVHVGKLIDTDSGGATAFWNNDPVRGYLGFCFEKRTWETLSPEQVSEYKREQAFAKVGRKLNEFRSGDIVYIESINKTAIVVSKQNDQAGNVRLHAINIGTKGHIAAPHQLTPISFVEDQVNLD